MLGGVRLPFSESTCKYRGLENYLAYVHNVSFLHMLHNQRSKLATAERIKYGQNVDKM